MSITTWILVGGAIVVVVIAWAMCVVAGRADDGIERYFRKQRQKVQLHGCARRKT